MTKKTWPHAVVKWIPSSHRLPSCVLTWIWSTSVWTPPELIQTGQPIAWSLQHPSAARVTRSLVGGCRKSRPPKTDPQQQPNLNYCVLYYQTKDDHWLDQLTGYLLQHHCRRWQYQHLCQHRVGQSFQNYFYVCSSSSGTYTAPVNGYYNICAFLRFKKGDIVLTHLYPPGTLASAQY